MATFGYYLDFPGFLIIPPRCLGPVQDHPRHWTGGERLIHAFSKASRSPG
jgi:hypothetical protein